MVTVFLLILLSPLIVSAVIVIITYGLAFWIFPGGGSRGPHDTLTRRIVGVVLVLVGETICLTVLIVMIPFRSLRPGPPGRKLGAGRVPVAVLPGYLENVATAFMLQRRLERVLDTPVRVLRPIKYFASLDTLTSDYQRQIEAWIKRTGASQVDLVGHSMGGIIARYFVESGRLRNKIRRVITVGSPHQGTALALLGPGKGARQLRRGSAFLERLNSGPTREEARITGISSTHDNMILPWNCALSPRGDNFIIRYRGHIMLLFSREIIRLITRELSQE